MGKEALDQSIIDPWTLNDVKSCMLDYALEEIRITPGPTEDEIVALFEKVTCDPSFLIELDDAVTTAVREVLEREVDQYIEKTYPGCRRPGLG